MPDLSIIIPARQEMFLGNTIDSILTNMEGDTEIIVILDGYWPDPPIQDNPRVVIVHHTVPVGQRGGTNEGARMSKSKFLMKLDAHCSVDKGFDVKLMADCESDWTVIPRMWNLHAFDWQCKKCGKRTYQGPILKVCDEPECGGTEFERVIVWQPRRRTITDFAMFDNNMHFQYWREYGSRPQAQGDIADVMCSVGACWFMHRERFWELGGMDETHGSWGQFGVETACKAWLSGGRQVVNKKTWFAHMFRTRHDFSFPYQISGNDQERARIYSRDLWLNDKWGKATLPLKWLVDKFAPVPTWI
ncbi:glycosyltransferase family 2 protein [Methanomethylovorans sp.]|uniref:glycosyltransferase family 2 protein n=1 Tax=Methanomethylovorans sp. TaxID=2758717 RepID=UPI00351C81B5